MRFTEAEAPPWYHHGRDPREIQRERDAIRKPGRQALTNAHKRRNTLDNYLTRPFIGWDGEGVTRADGSHVYVLLANSLGEHIAGTVDKPLGTEQCLRFIADTAALNPGATHIIYGGSYDANMILSDWNRAQVQRVYQQDYVTVGHWRIGYRPGKSIHIRDTRLKDTKGVTLYDVVSFFQCSFVKACDSYLGDSWPNRATVVAEKANRSSFSQDRMADIIRYCGYELDALLILANELRERLFTAGIRLKRWDGPGACAAALLTSQGVKAAQDKTLETTHPEVAKAARYAYAGGRFELVQFGHVEETCYQYDVCSAYPAALLHVPNLQKGAWRHVTGEEAASLRWDYALYHVSYASPSFFAPSPLFRRDHNGTICYPPSVVGWYWTPEARAAAAFVAQESVKEPGQWKCEVLEAWVFESYPDVPKPFAFIEPMYQQRRQWKQEGNGAHVGVKLALNSLYGKLAQQVGWKPARSDSPERLPPFHQLEWAGFVTSYTRAQVWSAIASDPTNVIAFETDAVFTMRPLKLDIGSDLGQWETTEYKSLTYLQSGFYFATTQEGKEICKSRGFDPNSVTRDACVKALRTGKPIVATQHRFVGMGVALAHWGNWRKWRRWEDLEKAITLAPTGKRSHGGCQQCNTKDSVALGVWHWTYCAVGMVQHHSMEFPVEWVNPDKGMEILSMLRLEGSEQWQEVPGDSAEFR